MAKLIGYFKVFPASSSLFLVLSCFQFRPIQSNKSDVDTGESTHLPPTTLPLNMAAEGEIQHSPTQGECGYTLKTALALKGFTDANALIIVDILGHCHPLLQNGPPSDSLGVILKFLK